MRDAERAGGSPSRSPDAVPSSSSGSNPNNLNASSPSSSSPPLSSSSSFRQTRSVDYIFHHRYIRLTWSIPNAYAFILEPLREAFLVSISSSPKGDAITTPLELALSYIEFLLTKEGTAPSLFEVVLQAFNTHFLRENTEIHCLIAEHTTSPEHRQRWIRAYYQAVEASGENYPKRDLEIPTRRPSAFFRNVQFNHFKVVALFGGQGDASRTCVQELSDLYDTYQSMLRPLVRIVDSLFDTLCQSPQTGSFDQAHRVHLQGWLDGFVSVPAPQIISSAPISVPMIGILSLARYCVVCHVLKLTPGELRDYFEATTGHSQGLLVAIAIAMSDSWESFYDNSRMVVEKLFWLGWECHRTAPCSVVAQAPSPEGLDGAGDPSYMLSVRGIECEKLNSILSHVNKLLPTQSQLHVALVNCRDQFVVAGPVDSLLHLHSYLATLQCPGDDQSRVPFSQRKPSIQQAFLPISTPFHTPYLQRAAFALKEKFHDSHISPSQLRIPVYHTRTGQDLRELNDAINLLDIAVDAIACEQCDWSSTLRYTIRPHNRERISHAVLFDRGGLGTLVKKMTGGEGIRIIQGSELDSRDPEMGSMRDLFSPILLDSTTRLRSWGRQFQPHLVTEPTIRLETRLSRLLGAPPVFVAGMTPTTMHWDFVSTIMNAGYHVELAGGGYHTSSDMAAAIENLAEKIPPGRGITCNLIYANPRAMRWQIALLKRLINEQVPIEGLTIGAGVPSLDVVTDYIKSLRLRHISFKPGSVTGIRQVIAIARLHPEFPIILQWTGGRGGGHHSFEDFHAPILSTYGLIRQQSNIYLVAGSGFGDGDSVYQYLTGAWSTQLGHASMPFDGALLGSRMMVASEAHTSPSVKQRIVKTPGVPDDQWENTYLGASGGIVTVQSEMGEPIHKIATKGVLLWAEMDKTVFGLARKDRVSYLSANRATIIRRLNSDFAKPWFGKSKTGDVVDLEDMTYLEVLMRMVELMYIKNQRRWIDPSYIDFTMRVTVRALERLQSKDRPVSSISRRVLEDDPEHFISAFASICPSVEDLLNPEDVSWFLIETKRAGQKPVNFIPALNDDFEWYFKKDSLWQSEDIDAVVNQDVERVCILHGPVAAQYSKSSKESAKEILDSIIHSLVVAFQREGLPVESTSAPDSGLVTPDSWSSVSAGREIFTEEMSLPSSMTLSDSQDDSCKSAEVVGVGDYGFAPAWARAMLGDKNILQSRVRSRNPYRDFLESHPEATVRFDPDRSEITVLHPVSGRITSSFRMTSSNGEDVNVEVYAPYRSTPLQLLYRVDLNSGPVGVSEIMKHRTERISSFYSKLWFGEQLKVRATMHDTFDGPKMTLTRDVLSRFLMVSGTAFADHRVMFADSDEIPIGMGIIIAWDTLTQPLIIQGLDADLLRLVHRSNTFRYLSGATPLRVGDVVTSQSRVQAVSTDDSGKTITVEANIIRFGKPVMAVTSSFLFKGSVTRSIADFAHTIEPVWKLHLRSKLDEAILLHREWFEKCESAPSLAGQLIAFNLETHVEHKEGRYSSLHVTGNASCQLNGRDWEEVGMIDFKCSACNGNPVLDFLKRRGTLRELQTDFELTGWTGPSSLEIKMPPSNQEYAEVSKDFNPIHVSPIFANLAQLPSALSHGMCTSAIATMALEHLVLDGDRVRLRKFTASFTGMVFPSEVLVVQLKHSGMIEGRMKFAIDVIRKTNGENVLVAEAEVEQPPTAYLFTGQGSQSKGMGMDLYRSSPIAKALWDEIDGQLYNTYGWSVLDIVQHNPKSHTIHFGGHRGRQLKQRYLSITTQIVQPDGSRVQQCVLSGLTPESTSYTFTDPRGLLYSTQFAQPAILLFEAAVFADLRARGYVSQDAVYAGHSLGEYGALSALAQNIPVGALAELAFYRGLMMQASVASKDQGTASTYGMMAVNPARVGKYFNQTALDRLVHLVSSESQDLLEIVNFNVEGEQYVCAGTTPNLYVLGKLLDFVADSPDGAKLVRQTFDASEGNKNNTTNGLHRKIGHLLASAKAMEPPLELQRGRATIPLQGIDVPFHSSHLRSTVDRFRECLLRPGFLEGNVDVEQLIGRYIPNLLARPFSLDEEYIKEAYELTRSPVLAEMLGIVQ